MCRFEQYPPCRKPRFWIQLPLFIFLIQTIYTVRLVLFSNCKNTYQILRLKLFYQIKGTLWSRQLTTSGAKEQCFVLGLFLERGPCFVCIRHEGTGGVSYILTTGFTLLWFTVGGSNKEMKRCASKDGKEANCRLAHTDAWLKILFKSPLCKCFYEEKNALHTLLVLKDTHTTFLVRNNDWLHLKKTPQGTINGNVKILILVF